jgi:hypothetical protein
MPLQHDRDDAARDERDPETCGAPFAGPRRPSRSYYTYVPDEKVGDERVVLRRSWLEREGICS